MTPLKYYVFKNIMENGAFAPFCMIFSKLKFLMNIFNVVLKWKMMTDLKIAYEVKG